MLLQEGQRATVHSKFVLWGELHHHTPGPRLCDCAAYVHGMLTPPLPHLLSK